MSHDSKYLSEIINLVLIRQEFKEKKEFQKSDQIRGFLKKEKNVTLFDCFNKNEDCGKRYTAVFFPPEVRKGLVMIFSDHVTGKMLKDLNLFKKNPSEKDQDAI